MNPQTDTPESAEAIARAKSIAFRIHAFYGGAFNSTTRCGQGKIAAQLNKCTAILVEALTAQQSDTALKLQRCEEALRWHDGYPKHPYSQEWFIALTKYGERAVLRALPEEWSYDFTTADETYMKKENVVKWMQFPDSEFIPPDALTHPTRNEGEKKV